MSSPKSQPRSSRPSQVVPGVSDRELWEQLKENKGKTFSFVTPQGQALTISKSGISRGRGVPKDSNIVKLDLRPTPVPPEIKAQHFEAAKAEIGALEQNYPQLANFLTNNPTMTYLLPEIFMSNDGVLGTEMNVDIAASFLDSVANVPGYRSYAETAFETPVQQMFFNDVIKNMGADEKAMTAYLFAGLEERQANVLASKAFAWLRNNPLETEDDEQELLWRLINWAEQEQQHDIAQASTLGGFDQPQEFIERLLEIPVKGLIGWLSSPEEAIRRSGLTLGQEVSYQMGLDPDTVMWDITSGAFDAAGEFILDPLSWVAGLGLGLRATRTMAVSGQALQKGRLAFAARSAVPFLGRSKTPLQTRSLVGRAAFAFRARTVDGVLDELAKVPKGLAGKRGSVADDILNLLKEGRDGTMVQRYPQFATMTDPMRDAIRIANNAEEVVSVLKHGHLADNLADPAAINRAGEALADASRRYDEAVAAGQDARPLLKEKLFAQMELDKISHKGQKFHIFSDVPGRLDSPGVIPHKVPRAANQLAKAGDYKAVQGNYIAALRTSMRNAPEQLNLFDTKKSIQALTRLGQKYNVNLRKMDELINEFYHLDIGERQAWLIENFIPVIGDATGVAPLKYNLVEIFNRMGVRAFAQGDNALARLDSYVDEAGNTRKMAFLPGHMQAKFPFPTLQIDEIIKRYHKAGIAGLNPSRDRGLVKGFSAGTRATRQSIVRTIRSQLGSKMPDELARLSPADLDETLYQSAFSMVGGAFDARGALSRFSQARLAPLWRLVHSAFTMSMLALRPVQWLWRVVIMEEQLRSVIFNMPSMYTNPFAYLSDMRQIWYLNRANKWGTANRLWAKTVEDDILRGVRNVDEAVEAIRRALPEVADDILGTGKVTSVPRARAALGHWLGRQVLDRTGVDSLLNSGRRVSYKVRQRAARYEKAEAIRARYGFEQGMTPKDDWSEIQQKFIQTFLGDEITKAGSGVIPYAWSPTMSNAGRKAYGHAWADKVIELTEDGATRVGLKRLLALHDGETVAMSGAEFIQTPSWRMVRGNVRKMYHREVAEGISEAALADLYLAERVDEYVRHILGPTLDNAADPVRFLDDLVNHKKFSVDMPGSKFDVSVAKGNRGAAQRQISQLVVEQGDRVAFPAEIASATLNPFFMAANDPSRIKQAARFMIQTFGEKATQIFNRRPFYLRTYKRWFKNYMDLGLGEKLATELANEKAVNMTNYVMYNLDNAPAMVKKLNRYIPFFGATYEVMSTWAYKMPAAAGGYWAAGAPEFVRKIDRFMDALINIGLVKVAEGENGKTAYQLQVRRDPDTGTGIGDAASKALYWIRRTPDNVVGHLLGMHDALKLTETGYDYTLGNPIDPFDFGVFSFANLGLGMTPIPLYLLSKTIGPALSQSSYEHATVSEDETLTSVADRLEVDPADLARLNKVALIDLNGRQAYEQLFEDDSNFETIALPGDLLVPDSSLWKTWLKETVFPFGEIETASGIIESYTPQVITYMFRSLGLSNVPTDSFYDEGPLEGVGIGYNTESDAAVNAAYLEAFMHLEAEEGYISRLIELEAEANELVKLGSDRTATEQAMYEETRKEIKDLMEHVILRTRDMAAGGMFLRGVGGGFFPNTGRAVRQEAALLSDYWESREFAKRAGKDEGWTPHRRFSSPQEIDEFFEMVGRWLEDDTGDATKAWLKQEHPTIMAFLQPKTFWGPGGVPPQISSYEDYLDQVNSRDRVPVPLAVDIQRTAHAGLESDYWAEFVIRYGNDPVKAAANALNDYEEFLKFQEEYFDKKDALYASDDMNGAAYLNWLDRGDDPYSQTERIMEKQRNLTELLKEFLEIDSEIDDTMDENDIREHRKLIKQLLRKSNDVIRELREDSEETGFRNPYELALNAWWEEVYLPFIQGTDEHWEAIANSRDEEVKSLAFENLKMYMNTWADRRFSLFGDTTTDYPSPLDIQWARKSETEKTEFIQKRITSPLEWINLNDIARILDVAGADAARYFPTTEADMQPYNAWTIGKNEIEELKELGLITSGEATKAQKNLKEQFEDHLRNQKRFGELEYMQMWPIERLHTLGMLPPELEYFMPQVVWSKEVLAAKDKSPGSQEGMKILLPLFQEIIQLGWSDPAFGNMLDTMGMNLYKESSWDAFVPKLIANVWRDI